MTTARCHSGGDLQGTLGAGVSASWQSAPWFSQGCPLGPLRPVRQQHLCSSVQLAFCTGAGGVRDKEVGAQQGLRPAVAAAAMRVLRMRLLGVVCRHGGRGAGRLRHEVRSLSMLQPARCGRARSCAGPRQWQAKEQQKGKQAGAHDGRIVRGESGWTGTGVRVLVPPIRGFTVRWVGRAMECGICCLCHSFAGALEVVGAAAPVISASMSAVQRLLLLIVATLSNGHSSILTIRAPTRGIVQ